jgi:hypothetical protein
MRLGFTIVEQVLLAVLASNRGNLTLLLNLDLLTPTPSSDIRINAEQTYTAHIFLHLPEYIWCSQASHRTALC